VYKRQGKDGVPLEGASSPGLYLGAELSSPFFVSFE
jgi:hypothetical protein